MLGYAVDLIQAHQDDFWLNILAGVPFLFFDVIIITLLLPITLRWWDERAWRDTRLTAIQRLLEVYGNPLPRKRNEGASTDPLQVLDRQTDRSHESWAVECLAALSRKLTDYTARIDAELQSALPILDAPLTKEVLGLHYRVKQQVDRSLGMAVYLTERFDYEFPANRLPFADPRIDTTQLGYVRRELEEGSIAIGCAIQRLAVRCAPDADRLVLLRHSRPTMQLSACAELCAIAAYLDRTRAEPGAGQYGMTEASALYRAMVTRLEAEPPVALYAVGLYDRIRGRGQVTVTL